MKRREVSFFKNKWKIKCRPLEIQMGMCWFYLSLLLLRIYVWAFKSSFTKCIKRFNVALLRYCEHEII